MWSGSGVAALAVAAGCVGVQLLVVQTVGALGAFAALRPLLEAVFAFIPIGIVSISVLVDKRLTYFFGLQLNYVQAGFLLYLAVTAVLALVCWLGWRRQAVSGV